MHLSERDARLSAGILCLITGSTCSSDGPWASTNGREFADFHFPRRRSCSNKRKDTGMMWKQRTETVLLPGGKAANSAPTIRKVPRPWQQRLGPNSPPSDQLSILNLAPFIPKRSVTIWSRETELHYLTSRRKLSEQCVSFYGNDPANMEQCSSDGRHKQASYRSPEARQMTCGPLDRPADP
jgi:hypothetical protein